MRQWLVTDDRSCLASGSKLPNCRRNGKSWLNRWINDWTIRWNFTFSLGMTLFNRSNLWTYFFGWWNILFIWRCIISNCLFITFLLKWIFTKKWLKMICMANLHCLLFFFIFSFKYEAISTIWTCSLRFPFLYICNQVPISFKDP